MTFDHIRTTIEGQCHPPGQSEYSTAKLVITPAPERRAVLINGAGKVISETSWETVRIEQALGSLPRRLIFPDGALFETEDRAAIRRLEGNGFLSWLPELERPGLRLVAFVAVGIAVSWLVWRYAFGILVAAAVAMTPPSVSSLLDRGTIETLDRTLARPSELSAEQQTEMQAVFDRLLGALDERERRAADYRLLFRSMPGVGPNALALPGGTVIVTDSFVTTFDSANVRASVLGHEIAHVVEDHGLKQIYRSIGLFMLVTMVVGDAGSILEEIAAEGSVLLTLSFSRSHELDADRVGMRIAADAGYDPAGLLVFFREIETIAGNEMPEWTSTHPSFPRRIEAVRDFVESR